MKHYFIGIKIPPTFGPYVEEIRDTYHLRKAYKAIPHIEDLHITLLYIGPLPEGKLAELEEQLSIIASNHSPISLQVNGVSFFGSPTRPRVIYLSINENPKLANLQQDISSIKESKQDDFTPHITIAKKWKGTDDLSIEKVPKTSLEFDVNAFSLFTIHPKEKPMYEAVNTFKLFTNS